MFISPLPYPLGQKLWGTMIQKTKALGSLILSNFHEWHAALQGTENLYIAPILKNKVPFLDEPSW